MLIASEMLMFEKEIQPNSQLESNKLTDLCNQMTGMFFRNAMQIGVLLFHLLSHLSKGYRVRKCGRDQINRQEISLTDWEPQQGPGLKGTFRSPLIGLFEKRRTD